MQSNKLEFLCVQFAKGEQEIPQTQSTPPCIPQSQHPDAAQQQVFGREESSPVVINSQTQGASPHV
eukprot:2963945-Pyramimonas_sp.AAC.1